MSRALHDQILRQSRHEGRKLAKGSGELAFLSRDGEGIACLRLDKIQAKRAKKMIATAYVHVVIAVSRIMTSRGK